LISVSVSLSLSLLRIAEMSFVRMGEQYRMSKKCNENIRKELGVTYQYSSKKPRERNGWNIWKQCLKLIYQYKPNYRRCQGYVTKMGINFQITTNQELNL
jgi:hypothetical protein